MFQDTPRLSGCEDHSLPITVIDKMNQRWISPPGIQLARSRELADFHCMQPGRPSPLTKCSPLVTIIDEMNQRWLAATGNFFAGTTGLEVV